MVYNCNVFFIQETETGSLLCSVVNKVMYRWCNVRKIQCSKLNKVADIEGDGATWCLVVIDPYFCRILRSVFWRVHKALFISVLSLQFTYNQRGYNTLRNIYSSCVLTMLNEIICLMCSSVWEPFLKKAISHSSLHDSVSPKQTLLQCGPDCNASLTCCDCPCVCVFGGGGCICFVCPYL